MTALLARVVTKISDFHLQGPGVTGQIKPYLDKTRV